MLSRREFSGGLAAGVAVRRRSPGQPPPQPAPPANEPNLARILRTRKLRIAGVIDEEPYFYRDSATGQWSGFCAAMAGSLATELAVEPAIIESSWAESVAELHAGKIDLSYGPTPTAQRAMFADFANPLFYDTYAIIARKGFAPKSWGELNVPGSLVAVDNGSVRETAARLFAGNAAITGFKTRDEALLAVQSGRIDCFVATVLFALTSLKKKPDIGELVVPTPPLRAAFCPALPYDDDRRFRGVVDAWSEHHRGTGRIREWIMASLAKLGVDPGGLPPDTSF